MTDKSISGSSSLLENYVYSLNGRLGSLEDNVQKLATIVNKVINDQAVFDFKQEQGSVASDKLESQAIVAASKLEGLASRVATKLADQAIIDHDKIANVSSDFIKELNVREVRLNEALNAYKRDVDKSNEKRDGVVDSDVKHVEDEVKDLRQKIDGLQRWIWIATGGGAVVLFVFEVLVKLLGLGH